MAKKPLTMQEMTAQEGDLSRQEAEMENKISGSDTYWGESAPSGSDLALDIQARTLAARKKTLESNILSRKVYGDTEAAETAAAVEPQGVISKVLDVTMRPLYAEVGVAKHLLGKGEDTLLGSIMENEKQKDLWGNVLKSVGVNPKVSSVLGFGMDVIGDPINLLFGGGLTGLSRTGIGKVAVGAKKSGLEGAKLGAKTAALQTAAKIASYIPFNRVNVKAAQVAEKMAKAGIKENTPEFAQAIKNAFFNVSEKTGEVAPGLVNKAIGKARTGIYKLFKAAEEASNKYDKLTGWDVIEEATKRADRFSILEQMKSLLMKHPLGAKIVDQFEYNSNQWMQNAKLWNLVTKAFEAQGRRIKDVFDPETGKFVVPSIEDIIEKLRKLPTEKGAIAAKETGSVTPRFFGYTETNKGEAIKDAFSHLDDGLEALQSGDKARLPKAQFAYDALRAEVDKANQWADINDIFYRMLGKEERGAVEKGRNFIIKNLVLGKNQEKKIEYGKKLLDFYDIALGLFKSMKISSLSPSSIVYAILGNGTMQHMAGINMLRPEVYSRLKDAMVLLSGGKMGLGLAAVDMADSYERVLKLLNDDNFSNFWRNHGDLAERILGINVYELAAMEDVIRKNYYDLLKMKASKRTAEGLEIEKKISKNADAIRMQKNLDAAKRKGLIGEGSSLEQLRRMGRVRAEEMPTGILASEIGTNEAFMKFKENISRKAAEGKFGAKRLDWAFQRSKDFEKTDQVWKLQNFLLLTQDGVTERELLKLTNNFFSTTARIRKEDIVGTYFKNGEKYYKLSPEKALDISNEIFMNYAAMPAFVKAVRSLPILGSPFFSFQYAMLGKTGKTLLNNPAAFNQVNFLMKELEADRSPVEREALRTKYYSYLDKPGMINLGAFGTANPLYLNLAQMIPYYSLNIMNPSTRKFNDTIRGKFASVLDKTQLFKDPAGQILMDYVVLPSLLYDETPQNMFGGKLYPEGTPWWGKVGYAARSGAEAFLPSSVGWAAPLVPSSMKELIPSYPGRKIGYAVEGKTAAGVQTKEHPASKALRAYLSTVGINIYPVNLTTVISEIKKRQQQ